MIVFMVSFLSADGIGIGDQFFASIAVAREFSRTVVTDEGDEAVIFSSVTAPGLRGAELVRAALNRRGWMLPGSIREVERWKRQDGEAKKMMPRKLAEAPAMGDSKEELEPGSRGAP